MGSERGFALNILFVCTGNICRSPTAERLAVAYASRLQMSDFTASSAGTLAVINHPVHPAAASVLEQLGGDASNFAARQLTSRIASDADLVLTMTHAHRNTVLEIAPRQLRRTFTLTEAARLAADFGPERLSDLPRLRARLGAEDAPDIIDPIGQSTEIFSQVGSHIAELLSPVLQLCKRSEADASEA